MNDTILVERRDTVAVVTMNRPEKRNALRQEDWVAVGDAMNALGADDDVRCIVLRGGGEAAFCAGADIANFEQERSDRAKVVRYNAANDHAFRAVQRCRHPVIAMIHGFCIGGGFELALAADLRISGQSGRFGIPAKNLGLFLSHELIGYLVDAGGKAVAREVLLEGRIMEADEACAKGLITRVVADDGLEDEVLAAARRIGEGAPLAHRYHREAILRLGDPRPLSLAELESQYDYADTEDYMAGYQAFLKREKPRFNGR